MADVKLYCLRCRNRKKPYGIDERPFFSWKCQSDNKDVFQETYHLTVLTDGKTIWDSGEVSSDKNAYIYYDGDKLSDLTTYTWRVRVVFNNGDVVEGEDVFTTGVLDKKELKASFVSGGYPRKPVNDSTDAVALLTHQIGNNEHPEDILDAPVFMRKSFDTKKSVAGAYVIATSLGIYSLYIDGVKVSNILAPEYTSYKKHLEYQTYDVTNILKEAGDHVIGGILADGWYTGKIGLMGIGEQYGHENGLYFQLRIVYEDGSVEEILSDDQVKVSMGEYIYADLFVGEYVDLRRKQDVFSTDFDDSAWDHVKILEVDRSIFRAQSVDPVQIYERIKPQLIRTPKGELVLDAGRNIAGYTCFSIDSEAGVEIGLEHSEMLDRDGNFYQNIMGQNKNQKDRIITREGHTDYEPCFTFHGFRYVKVTGLSDINPDDFTIIVISTPMDETGEFSCSDERLNRLQNNIMNSQRGNMLCIPTDCPQRERAGWTGDMEVYAPTAAFNMDVRSLLYRWLSDVRNDQLPDGQITNISPYIDSDKYVNGNPENPHKSSAGWGDAIVLVPYALYQAYGDIDVLKENYDSMKAWMDYVVSHAGDDMTEWGQLFHFGDWLIPSIMAMEHNPLQTALRTKEEVALIYMAKTADCLGEIAQALMKEDDAEKYYALGRKARESFSNKYADENGIMRQQLQGPYVLAVHEHMLKGKQEQGAAEKLAALVEEAGALDTGFLSVPFLLETLCEIKRKDLAYRILFDDSKPGWLYALKFDATSVWENWAAVLPDGTRTDSSYNHFAFGCVGDFLYRRIGGIYREDTAYKKVRIDPDYECGLDYAKTSFDSVYGRISCEWA